MIRSIQILLIVLLLALASGVSAQTPLTCGIANIEGPSEVEPGMPLFFKARLAGMSHTTKPEFKWSLSAGTITSGQGTEELAVDTTGLGGQDLIATVELAGAPAGCKGSASITVQIKPAPIACGLGFDQYGDIKFEDEKARLDNFAIQLSNEPASTGAILMSAGKETFENETTERLARARSYLVKVREVDPSRIITTDCGFTQDLAIRLWIVPPGATSPVCDPVGIPLSEIKFTKPRPKSSKKQR